MRSAVALLHSSKNPLAPLLLVHIEHGPSDRRWARRHSRRSFALLTIASAITDASRKSVSRGICVGAGDASPDRSFAIPARSRVSNTVSASGASDRRIMFRQARPNSIAPIVVASTLGVANAMLVEAALSFLDLRIQLVIASWVNMLQQAQQLQVLVQQP